MNRPGAMGYFSDAVIAIDSDRAPLWKNWPLTAAAMKIRQLTPLGNGISDSCDCSMNTFGPVPWKFKELQRVFVANAT
jgi:hypothetical protein